VFGFQRAPEAATFGAHCIYQEVYLLFPVQVITIGITILSARLKNHAALSKSSFELPERIA
jgi:hypothetical protein